MHNDASASWLKFLNPESLKENLIRSSIYLTCWEMLTSSIRNHPRTFYMLGWEEDGEFVYDTKYKTEVLDLHKDPLSASAIWFLKRGAISEADIVLLKKIRKHRNEIAHELFKFIGSSASDVQMEFLNGMFYLDAKINKWWIQYFEIPINSDFDGRELTQEELDGVQSVSTVMMDLLIAVANGKEDKIRVLFEEMKKNLESKKTAKKGI